jgi:hypothetical protein
VLLRSLRPAPVGSRALGSHRGGGDSAHAHRHLTGPLAYVSSKRYSANGSGASRGRCDHQREGCTHTKGATAEPEAGPSRQPSPREPPRWRRQRPRPPPSHRAPGVRQLEALAQMARGCVEGVATTSEGCTHTKGATVEPEASPSRQPSPRELPRWRRQRPHPPPSHGAPHKRYGCIY